MKKCSISIVLLFSIMFFSCQNEESLIGEDLLVDDLHEIFVYPDSLIQVPVMSIREDSVSAQSQFSLVGSYTDSYFGYSESSCMFQVLLPNNEMSFSAISISNIELVIPYDGFYGDSLAEFNFEIHKLEENISAVDTVNYFSNQVIESSLIYSSNPISLSSIKESDTLQLNLPLDFGLNEILNLNSNQLNNNEAFTEAFKGFRINAVPISINNSAILYLETVSDNAFLKIDYLDSDSNIQSVNFPIGSQSMRLNQFTHNYTEAPVLNNDSDTLIAIQSMGGILTEIDLSFLQSLQDSGYIVNNATIKFNIANHESNITFPAQISLVEYVDNQLLSIEGITGGALNEEETYYEFIFTQHIQKILSYNHNTICRLYTYGRTSNADRLVLSNNIELILTLIKG